MTWKKIASIVGGVVLIISLITGIWAFDDRYAHSDDIKEIEQQTVDSFKDLKKQQTEEINKTRIEILEAKLELYQEIKKTVDKDFEVYRKLLDENPNDESIRKMYEELLKSKTIIDMKILTLNEKLGK